MGEKFENYLFANHLRELLDNSWELFSDYLMFLIPVP